MSWINEIKYKNSEGELRKTYDRAKGPDDNLDNILTVHSLRPHTLAGHLSLYKNVLHHSSNTLPKWYLESIGVYVSVLNKCDYCVAHHAEGLKKVLKDELKFAKIIEAILQQSPENYFENKWLAGLNYTLKLTTQPYSVKQEDIQQLQKLGFEDGEILEINQVVSYFNYANRTVLGLGVDLQGDILGLSPSDSSNPENWAHT